jgi:di/tricarboxylate transporter
MTGDMLLVFALLLATIALFISDRLRMDVVAIILIIALMLTGLLSPAEALAGFGDPLVILIAALFVVGDGLFRTGVAFSVGNWLMGMAGTSELRLLVLLMLVVAVLSAFMSNTGAVAIFIPVALNLASRAGIAPSRLLLPMAYAGSIGGMLTLIGTPPNLVVTTELSRAGLEPFNFFSFTPIGLLILAMAIIFILTLGAVLLPSEARESGGQTPDRLSLFDLVQAYGIDDRFHMLKLGPDSPLIGTTVGQALLRTRFGVTVIALERNVRGKPIAVPVMIDADYRSGDVLFMTGSEAAVAALIESVAGLRRIPIEERHLATVKEEVGLAEVLLAPRSELNGHTIREVRFREDYGLSVLGILRKGRPLREDLLDTRLEFGDSLLVGGGWRQIEPLQRNLNNFIVLTLPREMDEVAPYRERAPWALGIVAIMLVLMTFSLVPTVTAVLLAGLAMVLARCVTMEEAYKAVNWQSVVLIAGMLPMATALDKTGALKLIVDGLVDTLGDLGPIALMGGLFLLTTVLSQFISNTATAVLVAPIALGAATGLGVSPYPLLMTVALGASTAFSTPMASPVNTLVIGPGGYKFVDFLKLGIPLQLLAMAITLICVPLLFPL